MAVFSVTNQCLFRLIAHVASTPVAANAYGGFCLVVLILLSGYSIVRGEREDDNVV